MIMLIGVGHWMPSFVRAAALVHALLAALNAVEPVTKGHIATLNTWLAVKGSGVRIPSAPLLVYLPGDVVSAGQTP